MTDKAGVQSVIERLEKAEVGTTALDIEIQRLVDPERDKYCYAMAQNLKEAARGNGLTDRDDACQRQGYSSTPHYTASIDAAEKLLPERCDWFVQTYKFSGKAESSILFNKHEDRESWTSEERGYAATPAIALCIAALRSRSQP